ncbi:MAG: protein-glutamate O-methyltransferase CheR [Candidatus Methanomethyliaceae archaeon]|nr:protein-glutamate O-methyltransferase CheR [Candidatus Methanomethyliaceae archaeon]
MHQDISDEELKRIIRVVEDQGLTISYFKKDFLKRRIKSRMLMTKKDTVAEYYNLIKRDRNEVISLLDSAFINVSEFFRDPPLWDALSVILRSLSRNNFIRIWSAGCSCGEEPYSLALLISETLPNNGSVRIIATDIDENALKIAASGIYDQKSLRNVQPYLLSRYFIKEGDDKFRASERLKELVRFSKHDITKDRIFMYCDIILCRNLMIYFPREVQRELIKKFWSALKPGGYLVIGMSEILGEEDLKYFEPHNTRLRIYRKREVPRFSSSRDSPTDKDLLV